MLFAFPTARRSQLLLALGGAVFVVLILFLIAGCEDRRPREIPVGVHTYTGVLLPTELSLTRRGTHVLRIDTELPFYVESSTVNLRSFEGKRVAIRGIVQRNVDPSDDPVLVADQVTPSTDPRFAAWSLPILGVTLEAPREWIGVTEAEGMKFFLTRSGALLLRVYAQRPEDLPYHFRTAELRIANRSLSVTPILVGSTRAVRLVDARDNSRHVSFEHQTGVVVGTGATKNIVTFSYSPPRNNDPAFDEQFLSVVHSLTFSRAVGSSSRSSVSSKEASAPKQTSSSKAASSAASISGTEGIPCGGPAGILCGPGEYCEVTDLQTNIGKCRKL